MATESPRARYRPKGQGFLVFERNARRVELPLDSDVIDLPPPADPRLAPPPARGQIVRVEGGHAVVPLPGAAIRVNHRPLSRRTVLHGGDMLEVDGFSATYTAAREELPWPLTVIVWPPSGPSVEIRSHRARLTLGSGDADLQIDDDTLNGLHCTIKRYANGVMQLVDERSQNGVMVDGRRVVDSVTLRDGAEVRIGRTRLKAWTDAELGADGRVLDPLEAYDGLPSGGFDPRAPQEPLRPYAIEVGPDFAGKRRRTFDDDVPTRLEALGERVDVRARRRPADQDGYHQYDAAYGDEDSQRRPRPPEEAAAPSGAAQVPGRPRVRGQDDDDDDDGFGRKRGGGLTLVHDPGKPRRK